MKTILVFSLVISAGLVYFQPPLETIGKLLPLGIPIFFVCIGIGRFLNR